MSNKEWAKFDDITPKEGQLIELAEIYGEDIYSSHPEKVSYFKGLEDDKYFEFNHWRAANGDCHA